MQELRGQGAAEEGRQGGQVPALQGDGRTVTPARGGFEQVAGFLLSLRRGVPCLFSRSVMVDSCAVTETVTIPTPRGGLARMSRRVMNLAHMLTQNARRHGDRTGFVWGDRSWTWREIDRHVSALAAGLAARGVVKGDRILVHSKNCDEMFWSMFAAFRLGAVWVPTNFRLMPDEVAYLATASGAKAFLCHGDFPEPRQGGRQSRARIHLADRRGRVWREDGERGNRVAGRRQGR